MSILSKLTVTPLLYAVGVLLVACLALGGGWWSAAKTADVAAANLASSQAQLEATEVAATAWKAKANAAAEANDSCTHGIESLTLTLDRQQKACRATQAANQQAIAAARAEAADADATLKRFVGQFRRQTPDTDCGRALAALDAACPALEGY